MFYCSFSLQTGHGSENNTLQLSLLLSELQAQSIAKNAIAKFLTLSESIVAPNACKEPELWYVQWSLIEEEHLYLTPSFIDTHSFIDRVMD